MSHKNPRNGDKHFQVKEEWVRKQVLIRRERKARSVEGLSSLLSPHNAKQGDGSGSHDDEEFIMRSSQNGSTLSTERSHSQHNAPHRRSYHDDGSGTDSTMQRSQFGLPTTARNDLTTPHDKRSSESSEHDDHFATPPTSLPHSRGTSPAEATNSTNHSPESRPSQRVQPMPTKRSHCYCDDQLTTSDSQELAHASSGSNSPKMWHVNPLQQTQKTTAMPSGKQPISETKLIHVPPIHYIQETEFTGVFQHPTKKKSSRHLLRQASLPVGDLKHHALQSPQVIYTPPPQPKCQPTIQTVHSRPMERPRLMIGTKVSSDNDTLSSASPTSPGYSAPAWGQQKVNRQSSLQEDYSHYENGDRYRIPDSKNKNPPPPPQRSSSHIRSRQIYGQSLSPPPQQKAPISQSLSQPAVSPTTQSPAHYGYHWQQYPQQQLVSLPQHQSHPNYYQQSPPYQQKHPGIPQQNASPQKTGYHGTKQQSLPRDHRDTQKVEKHYPSYATPPRPEYAAHHQGTSQNMPYRQWDVHPSQRNPVDTAHSNTSSPKYDSESAPGSPLFTANSGRSPLLSPNISDSTNTTTTTPITTSSSPANETMFCLVKKSGQEDQQRPSFRSSRDPKKQSRSIIEVQPGDSATSKETVYDNLQPGFQPTERDDPFYYMNTEALHKRERGLKGLGLSESDPAWDVHIRKRERRREELRRSSSQERKPDRLSLVERVTHSEPEYANVPITPDRKTKRSSGRRSRSPRRSKIESSGPKKRVGESRENLVSLKNEVPEYANVSMEKKQKCEKKKVKEEEEPVYANVPIKGDRRRHHSGPSSYPKRINANSPERVNYLSPPLRYDRVAISPIHWSDRKEQMSPVDVEVDLVRGRPPASPKKPPDNLTIRQPLENPILDVKPESDSPVLKRTPEAMAKKTFNSPFSSLTRRSNDHSTLQSSTHLQQPSEKIQKKQDSPKPKKHTEKLVVEKPQENSVPKYDSMPTVPLSIKEQTSSLQKKRPDSPSPKMKRRMIKQSPSPVRRPRPKSFESEDSLPRKEKLEDRPVSVHGEVLMPGVVPPAIEYLRTKRGRGKVRSVKERHQRSHSVGPVQGSHTDLCYSASNLEHYARDRSDIKDTLSRSWGMEMFAKRTIFPQLLEGMDLKQNEGISNQAYEPDTLTRDAIWEKCVETADRMALNRSGSYENALEKGFISSSCSSPECRPKKEHSKNGKLYYVQSSEQDDVPLALKKYLGKKPARHRRSQDFEKALRELDEMYAKLDLETDHLYRPRPRGNRKSRSTEITLPLPTKTSSLKMNKNESPSQKAKRRARRERPHSYTGGLTTSDDSDDRHQIYNRFRHVKAKSSGKPIPGFPLTKLSHKYERFSPKIMAKNSSSSDDEYQPLHKSLSQGALNKHPDRSSSPSPEKRFQRTRRSKSADNFEKSIKAVTFAEPPKRPIGDLAIPSDISISQEDSPPVYLKMHQRQESSEVISGGDDSDSMCAQRGSTEHHISSSELDDADDEGDKELLSNKELPSNPVNSSTLSTINDEVLSQSFDALQTEYNVQCDITERFVQTQQQLTLNERKVSLLDEASIPMEDDSEDSEVKALMEPSVKSDKSKYKPVQVKPFFKSDRKKGKSTPSRKRMKKAKKEPGSPSSARRREVLEREGKTTRRKYQQSEERKQRIKNISSSSSDTDTDSEYSVDEEMSRTVSKLKAKITSEKHVETSAEKRRALFGDVGRSSSNPSSPLRKTEGKSWREPFRNADTEPDRYHRNRNRDESHKRYSRLTSERDYDLPSSPRRRMGSDSSESSVSRSEKDVKIDNTLKDRTSSTDSYPRLSPSYGIMDTQRSKSFDYDHRHSHLDNNHRTSDEILSKYTDDSLKDRTNDAKYNKDHVDSRAARKALLDNATKVKDDRHHSNDVVLKSTRQDLIDADSKTSRTKDIDYTTRRNLSRDEDLLSRRSSRDIVDRSGNDTYSSRYARTRDRTDEILMARLSDRQKYRSQKKEDEKEDKTHITTNGVTPPTATDLLLAKQAVAPKETERVIAMDTKLSADSSEDSDARAQRIAKYKEQRRKQLSEKYGIVGSLDSTADDLPSRRLRYSKRSNTDLGLTTDTLRRAEALIGKDKEDAPCETRPRRMASDVSIQKLDKDDYSYLRKKYGLERTPSTDTDTTSSKTSRNIDEDIASSRRSRLAKSTSLHDESPDVLPRRRRTIDVSPIVMETQETENKIKTVDDKSKVSATSAVIAEESPRTDSKPEISLETKELVEALETQRAARRERLRQTEILTTDKVSESILSKRRLSRDRSDLPQLAQTEDKEHDLKKRGEGTSIESPSIHERSKKVPEPEPVVPSGINVETQKVPSSIEQKNETSRHRPPTSGDIKTVDHSLQQSALVKDTMQGQRLRQPIGKESELLGKDSERKPRFYSLDSEASIESSSAAFESPSDSDSLSLASDIVRTMSPRSLEILERKRRRKEEKKALRRRSALNTPSKEDGRISPRSGSGDDSDGRQRFKQRQISPSSSQDDTGKSDSDQRVIQPSGGLKVTTPSDIMPESVPMRKSDIVPKKLEELKVEEKPEKGERERNEIKKVEQVDVHSVKVSEKGEHERNEIKKVEQVDVHSVKVSEKGEHERNEIKKVEQVDVHSAKVPEEGKHEIKDILKEEQVDVSSVKASEPDVSERKELAKEIKKEVAVVQKPVTETDGLEKRNDKEAGEKELERVIKADKARSPEMQPEQKKGAIAEGKQTKKLIEKLQGKKASTEKRKVLAEKVEESQRVLKEVRQKMGKHSGTQDEKSVPVAPAKVVADDVPKTIEERPKEFSKVREHPKSAETVKIAKQAENESKRDVPSHGVPDKRAGLIKSPRSTETDVPKIAKQRVSRTEKEEQRVTPVAKEEHLDSSKVDIKKDEKIKVRAQPKKLLSPEARKKPMVGRVDTSKTAQKRELTTKRPESLPVRGMTDKRIVDRGTSDSDKSDKSDPKSPRKSASSSSQPLRRPVSPEKKLRPKPEPSTKSPSPTSKADRTPSSRLGLRRTDSPLSSTDDETSSPRRKPRKRPEIPSVLKEAETRRTSPEPWRRRTTGSDSSDSDSRKVRLRGSGSDREERIKRFGKQTPKIKEESAAAKAPLRTRSSEQKKGTPKSVEESSKRSEKRETTASPLRITEPNVEPPKTRDISVRKLVQPRKGDPSTVKEIPCSETVKHYTKEEKTELPKKILDKVEATKVHAAGQVKNTAKAEELKITDSISKAVPRIEKTGKSPVEKVEMAERFQRLSKSPSLESAPDSAFLSVENKVTGSSLRRTASFKTKKELEKEREADARKEVNSKQSALTTKDTQLIEMMKERAKKIREEEDEEMFQAAERELFLKSNAKDSENKPTAEELIEKKIEKPQKLDISMWEKQSPDVLKPKRFVRPKSHRGKTVDIGEIRKAAEESAQQASPFKHEGTPTCPERHVTTPAYVDVPATKPPVPTPSSTISQEVEADRRKPCDQHELKEPEKQDLDATSAERYSSPFHRIPHFLLSPDGGDAQHDKLKHRRQSQRFRTQPVTKPEVLAAKQLTSVDGAENENEKDELSQMSVSEKKKLFLQMQKEQAELKAAEAKRGKPKRFARRLRSSERSQTQPVTLEEVKTAATLAEEEEEARVRAKIEEEIRKAKEDVKEEDKLSQLSLAEKMNLFKNIAETPPEKPPPKRVLPTRKKKRQGSRYKTQPVTIEELQSAKKISPLAISFSKPPDPELLATLPLSDQIALVYGDTGGSTATPEPSGSTKPKSVLRRSSVSNIAENRGILKESDKKEDDKDRPRGILKSEKSEEREDIHKEVRSILKSERRDSDDSLPERVRGILKSERRSSGSEEGERSILKKTDSIESTSDEGSPRRSVKPEKGMLKQPSPDPVRKHAGVIKHSPPKTTPERFKTQPIESPESATKKRHLHKYSLDPERHKTQPITVKEIEAVQMPTEGMPKSSSIADRLAALKKNGDDNWKKRIEKYDDSPTTNSKESVGENGTINNMDEVKLRDKSNLSNGGRPQSVAERLQQLQECEHTWKDRVETHDAHKHTVAGKLLKAGKEVTPARARRPRKARPLSGSFKLPEGMLEGKPKEGQKQSPLAASKSKEEIESKIYGSSSSTTSSDFTSESELEPQPTAVEIHQPDNEDFTEFFKSSSVTVEKSFSKLTTKSETIHEVDVSDFDLLAGAAKPMLTPLGVQKRTAMPQRRAKASSNPLKTLKARPDVKSEYTEIRAGHAEREFKRTKKEQIEKESTFASSALAGLASTEDFSNVALRKTSDVLAADQSALLLPYKDVMLLQIKGRRSVQVRLVEPVPASLNKGDCFVLVTPKALYLWQGEYANVIEKAKAGEVAQTIQAKKDLGCKAGAITMIDEEKGEFMGQYRAWRNFFETIGGRDKYGDAGPPEEDEDYEVFLTEANMMYTVTDDSLVPIEEYWGVSPKVAMLDSTQVLVFDFGSELYIWQGRQSSLPARKMGVRLAKQLWDTGFDYSDCEYNPFYPMDHNKPKKGQRPPWALFAKVNERVETVLFRSKFQDWPDDSRIIKVKGPETEEQKGEVMELKPYDAKMMATPNKEKPYLVLEGVNVGRGTGLDCNERKDKQIEGYYDKVERRGTVITTLSVVTWHVLEYEHSIVPKESFGQFHEGDTYVVRWQFRVEAADMKDLKGNLSKRAKGHGKEKCAYFFWQGLKSTINEKGASALMTVELDEERGPQIRVVQGKESPAFLQLFQGAMVIHIGKREEEDTNTQGAYRLYCVRSEDPSEGFLVEVPCTVQYLRSRTAFILLNLEHLKRNKAEIILWFGSKASSAIRKVAKATANQLKERRPLECSLSKEVEVKITEMEEGDESTLFWKALGEKRSKKSTYNCLIDTPLTYDYSARLFHLTSTSGVFEAIEILNPSRSDRFISPFPFLQSDLYNVSQPAQFLFDNHTEMYLWQGWWPEDRDEAHYGTGSAKMRWDQDRKLAMETVMDYCQEKSSKKPVKAYIVDAGLEPMTFTNLFPYWHHPKEVEELNRKEGKTGDVLLVKDVLAQLTKSRYTLEELKVRPLPEGVDPSKLEAYLSDEEFQKVLEMSKEEFYQLPPWKQNNLKKDHVLF